MLQKKIMLQMLVAKEELKINNAEHSETHVDGERCFKCNETNHKWRDCVNRNLFVRDVENMDM